MTFCSKILCDCYLFLLSMLRVLVSEGVSLIIKKITILVEDDVQMDTCFIFSTHSEHYEYLKSRKLHYSVQCIIVTSN